MQLLFLRWLQQVLNEFEERFRRLLSVFKSWWPRRRLCRPFLVIRCRYFASTRSKILFCAICCGNTWNSVSSHMTCGHEDYNSISEGPFFFTVSKIVRPKTRFQSPGFFRDRFSLCLNHLSLMEFGSVPR
jgi:hypothetical protein